MEEIKLIGLNIWGIRSGFRSFCHSENLDIEEPEIKNTWKDIRDFVYVSNLGVRFYALEFTPNYKVFTLYRPVNDTSRTGAYVGTTLYVPHQLRINNTVELLKQISDAYYKDHYDAFGNPNTNPDYMPTYQAILDGWAGQVVREAKKRTWEASAQDNTPKILPYSDVSVVERFFSSPYRHEFVACQEVMFWDNNFIQNMQTYGVKFQRSDSLNEGVRFEVDGKDIKDQFNGGRIMNQPGNGHIVRFVCNGNDITQTWQSAYFDDGDMIEIIMRKPSHNDVVCSGAMARCGLFRKTGTDYHFVDVNFTPKTYKLMVSTPDVKDVVLYFNFDAVQVTNGVGVYDLKGNQLNDPIRISLRYGNTGFSLKEVNPGVLYDPSTDNLKGAALVIQGLKTYHFQYSVPCQGTMEFANKEINFATDGNGVFDLVLPSNLQLSAQSVNIKVKGYDVTVEPDGDRSINVRLTPNSFNAIIYVPRDLESHCSNVGFRITAEGYKYSTTSAMRIELPQRLRNEVKSGKAILELLHGNKALPCKYSVFENNGNELTLTPELQLVHNATDVSMTIQEVALPANGKKVWPVKDFALKDGFETEREKKSGYQLLTLKKKAVAAPVSSANTKAQPVQHGGNSNIKGPKNEGGRDRNVHHGDSDEQKKRLFLYGGIGLGVVMVTLLVLAIVLGWFGGGKNKEGGTGGDEPEIAQYTVKILMADGADIENIEYIVKTADGHQKEEETKESDFSINKEGCESISITVNTKGMGTCGPIELVSMDEKLEIESDLENKDSFSFKNDKAVITLVSPATIALDQYTDPTIRGYDSIAKKYPGIQMECATRAFDMVDSLDRVSISDFQPYFRFPEAQEYHQKCDEYTARLTAEENAQQSQQKMWDDFVELLKKVKSINCTKDDVKALEKAYQLVKDDEKKYDVMKDVLGKNVKQENNTDWMITTFFPKHKSFFDFFEGDIDDYDSAKAMVNLLKQYTSCFNKDQRDAMDKLVSSEGAFRFYLDNKALIKNKYNGAVYQYLKKENP